METATTVAALLQLVGFTVSTVQAIARVQTSLDGLDRISSQLEMISGSLIFLTRLEKWGDQRKDLLSDHEFAQLQGAFLIIRTDSRKLLHFCQKYEKKKSSKRKLMRWVTHGVHLCDELVTRLQSAQISLMLIVQTLQGYALPYASGCRLFPQANSVLALTWLSSSNHQILSNLNPEHYLETYKRRCER